MLFQKSTTQTFSFQVRKEYLNFGYVCGGGTLALARNLPFFKSELQENKSTQIFNAGMGALLQLRQLGIFCG